MDIGAEPAVTIVSVPVAVLRDAPGGAPQDEAAILHTLFRRGRQRKAMTWFNMD
jgi:hypothetical protein